MGTCPPSCCNLGANADDSKITADFFPLFEKSGTYKSEKHRLTIEIQPTMHSPRNSPKSVSTKNVRSP